LTPNDISYSFTLSGNICGFDASLYLDSVHNIITTAGTLKVANTSLEKLLQIIGNECYELVSPYVKLLGTFELDATYYHRQDTTIVKIDLEEENVHFVCMDCAQGKLVVFSIEASDFRNADSGLKSIVLGLANFFGINKLQFLYRSNDLTNVEGLEKIVPLPSIPITVTQNILFSAEFDFNKTSKSIFTEAIHELFGVSSLSVFVGLSNNSFACTLCIPDIDNSLLSCKDMYMSCSFSPTNASFSMRGIITFKFLSNFSFVVACNVTMTSFTLSASTMRDQICALPGTHISIYDSALAIGVETSGITFAIMTSVRIRELSWFGALKIAYQGQTATLEMLSVAMEEVSLPSLVRNLIGIDSALLNSLDIFSILPFTLHTTRTLDPNTMYDLPDKELVAFVNEACGQLNKSLCFTEQTASIKRFYHGIDILDTSHMIHYFIDEKGVLCLTPQFYYSVSTFMMGDYSFQKGTFFCGQVNLFGFMIKVMFSALEGEGIIGFAQFSPIETKFLKITASESSKSMGNPVLGSDTNNVMTLLVEPVSNSPILYVNVCKNNYGFYIDGHFELCKVFSFDAFMYFIDKQIRITTTTTYFNCISATILLDASYKDFSNAGFNFKVSLDCSGLQDNLRELTRVIDQCIKEFAKKIDDAKRRINEAQAKVSSINNDINDLRRRKQDCINTINRASRWKRWLVAIREGAKIVAFEASIAALTVSMKAALGILELAKKALDLGQRIGQDVLSAINKVITTAVSAFFIRLAELEVKVNGETQFVRGKVDLTLLGRDTEVGFNCDMGSLVKNPVKFIEDEIIKKVKDFFNQYISGNYQCPFIEAVLYDEFDVPNTPESVEIGVRKLGNATDMIHDLQQVYINEMKDIPPEFEDIDQEFLDTMTFISYAMDSANSNSDIDAVDDMIVALKDKIEKGSATEEDKAQLKKIEEEYFNVLRPTISSISESAKRLDQITQSVDVERNKRMLRSLRAYAEEENGCETMAERNYEKLYDDMQAVITQYFPPGTGEGYFNFTDEEEMFKYLNEAREDTGCPTVPVDEDRFTEYGKAKRFSNSGYKQRLKH